MRLLRPVRSQKSGFGGRTGISCRSGAAACAERTAMSSSAGGCCDRDHQLAGAPAGNGVGSSRCDACASRQSAGKTIRVSSVDEMMPPITTVASGRCTSAPVPTLRAIGTNPRLATSAVINTGRSLVSAPCLMDSSMLSPRSRNCRMNDSITTPLRTAIPDNAMKPTPAEIDSGIPRRSSANTPPVSASGTPVNTINVSLAEPKAA